ncbi:MAG: hypothetical protein K5841_10180, partial [Fretibacterium sp.]|nr:hypothetical protein [Fretibacterium sp.]
AEQAIEPEPEIIPDVPSEIEEVSTPTPEPVPYELAFEPETEPEPKQEEPSEKPIKTAEERLLEDLAAAIKEPPSAFMESFISKPAAEPEAGVAAEPDVSETSVEAGLPLESVAEEPVMEPEPEMVSDVSTEPEEAVTPEPVAEDEAEPAQEGLVTELEPEAIPDVLPEPEEAAEPDVSETSVEAGLPPESVAEEPEPEMVPDVSTEPEEVVTPEPVAEDEAEPAQEGLTTESEKESISAVSPEMGEAVASEPESVPEEMASQPETELEPKQKDPSVEPEKTVKTADEKLLEDLASVIKEPPSAFMENFISNPAVETGTENVITPEPESVLENLTFELDNEGAPHVSQEPEAGAAAESDVSETSVEAESKPEPVPKEPIVESETEAGPDVPSEPETSETPAEAEAELKVELEPGLISEETPSEPVPEAVSEGTPEAEEEPGEGISARVMAPPAEPAVSDKTVSEELFEDLAAAMTEPPHIAEASEKDAALEEPVAEPDSVQIEPPFTPDVPPEPVIVREPEMENVTVDAEVEKDIPSPGMSEDFSSEEKSAPAQTAEEVVSEEQSMADPDTESLMEQLFGMETETPPESKTELEEDPLAEPELEPMRTTDSNNLGAWADDPLFSNGDPWANEEPETEKEPEPMRGGTPEEEAFAPSPEDNEHNELSSSLESEGSEEEDTGMGLKEKLFSRKKAEVDPEQAAEQKPAPKQKSGGSLLLSLLLILLIATTIMNWWELHQLKSAFSKAVDENFSQAKNASQETKEEKKYEYEYAIDFLLDQNIAAGMARRGREGWQIAGSRRTQDSATGQYGYEFIFMRPLPAMKSRQ